MRRTLGISAMLVFLAACGQDQVPSITDLPVEETTEADTTGTPTSATPDLYDGSPGASSDNPHFFFLEPIIAAPAYSGVLETGAEPAVTICPRATWSDEAQACTPGTEIARYSTRALDPADQISEEPGIGYQVTWNTTRDPARAGEVYRVSVFVVGQLLGYVDVLAYDVDQGCETGGRGQRECETRPYDPAQGHAAFYAQGTLDIRFRIEEGAIESEYCDPTDLEDCDVEVFTYEEGGCLRVFESPGQSGEILGSQACVPDAAAELDGEPVEGAYAVILTLEKDETFQGSGDGYGQVPFFPDLRTDPPGIDFDASSSGISLVLCQATEGDGTVSEEFHPWLRPFIIYENGDIALPEEYSYGAPECEGFDSHLHASSEMGEAEGVFGKLAAGAAKIGRFLLPAPLRARRLHGGLNTTVYKTRGNKDTEEPPPDDDGSPGAEGQSGETDIEEAEPDYLLELGAVLAVDPTMSLASVPGTGQVGATTTILVDALDPTGQPFPFELPVSAEVSGSNPGTLTGELVALGRYALEYTPASPGEDTFVIAIEGQDLPGTFASQVEPVPASAANSTFQVSESQVGSPTRVTVDVRDASGAPYDAGEDFPVQVGVTVTSQATGSTLVSLFAADGDGAGVYDGTYEVSFTLDRLGAYRVAVTVDGQATQDGPKNLIPNALPADPEQSTVEATDAVVGEPTTISVLVFNTAADVYDYNDYRSISVEVTVTGANPTTFQATDPDLDGTFLGQYTPIFPGVDEILVSIDGNEVPGTVTSDVESLAGALRVEVDISGGAPEDGLPIELLGAGGGVVAQRTTGTDGSAVFPNVPHGLYRARLAARDFDVAFQSLSLEVSHDGAGSSWLFEGVTQELPPDVGVWRVRDGGSGNAYQYVDEIRGWVGALSEAETRLLLDSPGHLATLTSREENDFVRSLFLASPSVCAEGQTPASCTDQAWIGLTDREREGRFRWVSDEPLEFTRWFEGRVPPDPWSALDFVAFDARGFWAPTASVEGPAGSSPGPQGVIVNGVEVIGGYLVEWEAETETGGT